MSSLAPTFKMSFLAWAFTLHPPYNLQQLTQDILIKCLQNESLFYDLASI